MAMTLYIEEVSLDEHISPNQTSLVFTSRSYCDSPPARGGATLTPISPDELVLIAGANRQPHHYSSLHLFNQEKQTWSELHPKGRSLPPRSGHTALALQKDVYVFGGINLEIQVIYNDLWKFNCEQKQWTELTPHGDIPCPRNCHTMVQTGSGDEENGEFWVFGGSSPEVGALNDLYRFDVANLTWEKVSTTGTCPSPREMHSSVLLENKMYVYGGRTTDGSVCNDLFVLDLDTRVWKNLDRINQSLCGHVAFPLSKNPTRFGIFGGYDGQLGFSNDILVFDTSTSTWIDAEFTLPSDLAGRFAHSVCVSRESIYTFGGMNVTCDLSCFEEFTFQKRDAVSTSSAKEASADPVPPIA